MSKIKFTYNKAYNYVTNTHPIHIFFDTVAVSLGALAFTGISFMIFMLVTGQVDQVNINCGICY